MKVGVFYWHTKQTQQWNLSEKTVDAANPANHWCLPSSRLNPHTASTCCCGCSVTESRPTLCDPMDCSTPGFPVLYYVQEFAQTHVHSVSDAIRPSHSLPPLFLHTFNFSQYQGLSQWVSFLHQVAKILEFQLQHQSFQRIWAIIQAQKNKILPFMATWIDLKGIKLSEIS